MTGIAQVHTNEEAIEWKTAQPRVFVFCMVLAELLEKCTTVQTNTTV